MNGENGESAIRRFLVMGCCSAVLHVLIAAVVILPGMNTGKSAKVYRVEVKYLQPETRQVEEVAPVVPEQSKVDEARKDPDELLVVDMTVVAMSVLPEIVELPEEAVESVDVVEASDSPMESIEISLTPVPLVENAIITPYGGLGSVSDAEASGGNSLFALGTGIGLGGGPGDDGYGGGTGSSRGTAGVGSGKTSVYYAGMPGITAPVYERTSQPSYPASSRARGEQGEVLLKVEVLVTGRVGQAEVEKSSGYATLDEAALTTVRRWRFKPALLKRETVICWVNIPIRFRLN